VKLLDLSQTDNNLYLFLEYCNGGSLEDYLKKNDGRLSEDEACLILSELLEAFLEMNEKSLMHRDIKPANILIHNGKIKLADFGFSRVFDEADNA
jgi:serine/threonine protein kinase